MFLTSSNYFFLASSYNLYIYSWAPFFFSELFFFVVSSSWLCFGYLLHSSIISSSSMRGTVGLRVSLCRSPSCLTGPCYCDFIRCFSKIALGFVMHSWRYGSTIGVILRELTEYCSELRRLCLWVDLNWLGCLLGSDGSIAFGNISFSWVSYARSFLRFMSFSYGEFIIIKLLSTVFGLLFVELGTDCV